MVASVAFSPDGKILAAGSDDEKVWLWNLADPAHPTRLGQPLTGPDSVNSVAFSPDGKTLAAGSGDARPRCGTSTSMTPSSGSAPPRATPSPPRNGSSTSLNCRISRPAPTQVITVSWFIETPPDTRFRDGDPACAHLATGMVHTDREDSAQVCPFPCCNAAGQDLGPFSMAEGNRDHE